MEQQNSDQMDALGKAGLVSVAGQGTDLEIVSQVEAFDGPLGFDGVDKDCTVIPFLKIAQSGTDEAKKGSPKRIEGLEPGMFFCPATRRVYGDDVNLIILRFYRQYIIYSSKEKDAKFLGSMTPEQFASAIEPYATRERSYHLDSEGHRYVDTRNFIVLVAGHYTDGPMLLSLNSTGITPSKRWITAAQNVRTPDGQTAPLWSSVWNLVTGYFDNDLGSYNQISRVERMGYVGPKYRNLVVNAFLDAQAAGGDVLEKSMEVADLDGKPAQDASHNAVSNTPAPASKAKPSKAATAPGPDADEIF